MAQTYARKSFLLQAPNELLRRYLAPKGLGVEIAWEHLAEKSVSDIERSIEAAPRRVWSSIDGDFRRISDLAEEGGVRSLIAEGLDPHHDLDLASLSLAAPSRVHFAFQVFLDYPDVFKAAHDLYRAESVSHTRWRVRDDLLGYRADTSKAGAARLGKRLSQYYMLKEGRGQCCHVEHWRRDDRLYWFARPEDFGQAPLGYDDQQELVPQPQRTVFDIIFQYCEAEGWLKLLASADRQTRQDLQRLFGEAILRARLPAQEVEPVTYELDALMDRDLPLAVEAEDGVETVRVKRLRLRVLGAIKRSVTLEAESVADPKAVYDLLNDALTNSDLGTETLQLTGVGFQLEFRPNERGKRRKLTFDVGYPNSCSLHDGDPLHDVAGKLLRRWGIDVSARARGGAAPRRRSYQRGLDL
jgi:hypothetical protein